MGKKKAIKLATATAIAASAFVAVAPTQSEAATSSVDKAITKATKQMAKAYDTYHKAAKNDSKLPATGTIRNQTALAKDYYNKAKAEIAVNGGSKTKKAAYTKTLDSKKHFLDRAQAYVNAINTNLNPAKTSFTKAVEVGKAKQVLAAQTVLNKDIAAFEGKVAKIYGPDARNLLLKKYADPASKLADSVNDEMKVYKAYKEIENGFLIEKDIVKAIELRDSVKDEVKKLEAKNTKLATSLLAAVKKNNDAIDVANSPAVSKITAVNATTVEVTYKEKVKDIEAKDYKIEGLTITNAAVKQTDDKTVVLTTSTQEGGKEYTVKSGEEKLGLFNGISAVVPTSIKLVTTSVQSQVGKEVTLTADIGSKNAGVPVTFNVDALATSLNKDQVVESYTNAEGIATYTYTQYSAGVDTVAVYPTGAPTVRAFATVYWGVQPIITVESADNSGNALANGSAKTYKVTYRDEVTGAPVANKNLNVTFAENLNVTADKLSTATVKDLTGNKDGKTPYQLTNGDSNPVSVTTDKNGVATFTVTGTNTSATPIVFADNGNGKWDATELFATTDKVVFSGAQVANKFTLTATGSNHTAVGKGNGRVYKVVVTDKDGKPYAGGVVNLALNETIDKEIGTNSEAYFTTNSDLEGSLLPAVKDAAKQIKLNSKGEAEFILASDKINDYGTPVIWIDQNFAENNQTGVLENGEPTITGEKTFFEAVAVKASELKIYNGGKEFTKTFAGNEEAEFRYNALNQSGNVETGVNKRVTYEVTNNGSESILVRSAGNSTVTVEAYGKTTIKVEGTTPSVFVSTKNGDSTSVSVTATGYELKDGKEQQYLGTQSAKASFSKYATIDLATGIVSNVNTADSAKTLTVTDAKDKAFNYNYKGASYQLKGQAIDLAAFEVAIQKSGTKVTVTKFDDKLTFNILEEGTGSVVVVNKDALNATITEADKVVEADYTEASFAPFKTALADAKIVKANASATQAQVDAAAKAVTDAQKALVNKDAGKIATVTNATFIKDVIVTTTEATPVLKVSGLTFTSTASDAKFVVSKSGDDGQITNGKSGEDKVVYGTFDFETDLAGTTASEANGDLQVTVSQPDEKAVSGTVSVLIKDNAGKSVSVVAIDVTIAENQGKNAKLAGKADKYIIVGPAYNNPGVDRVRLLQESGMRVNGLVKEFEGATITVKGISSITSQVVEDKLAIDSNSSKEFLATGDIVTVTSKDGTVTKKYSVEFASDYSK